jgi:hypothetical protein
MVCGRYAARQKGVRKTGSGEGKEVRRQGRTTQNEPTGRGRGRGQEKAEEEESASNAVEGLLKSQL